MRVDSTTVGNWETGKRQMTLEKLMFMAEVTEFTVQYLLGFDDVQSDWTKPLSKETLAVMHRAPVLAYSLYGSGEPLTKIEVEYRITVRVEPITLDTQLSMEHVHRYLSLDEEWMRMCPLSLEVEGIGLKGGFCYVRDL